MGDGLEDGGGCKIASQKQRSFVESRSVGSKVDNPSQVGFVLQGPQVYWAEQSARQSIPKGSFICRQAKQSGLEGLNSRLGVNAGVVMRNSENQGRDTAGENEQGSNAGGANRKPGPEN